MERVRGLAGGEEDRTGHGDPGQESERDFVIRC
jgi:hypothetical protein